MSEVVLDASAVLALLNEEAGSEEIARFRGKAAISTVNLSEVVAKLAEWGISVLPNLKCKKSLKASL